MNAGLRDSLRAAANESPTYNVYDATLRTVARRRRHRISGWLAAVTTVVLSAGIGPAVLSDRSTTPFAAADTQSSLPDIVGVPGLLGPGLGLFPKGPAALVMGGWGSNDSGDTAVVGATANWYRTFTVFQDVFPGSEILISPNGSTLAIAGSRRDHGVKLVDLATGNGVETTGTEPGAEYSVPLAWSPDGSLLAVRTVTQVTKGGELNHGWGLLNVHTGEYRRVSDNHASDAEVVAFAPDGRRLAYQNGRSIRVYQVSGLDLIETSYFEREAGVSLAGKGAWTPDGAALLTIQQTATPTAPLSPTDAPAGDWRLVARDPATGAELAGAPQWPVLTGLGGVRLLGWGPQGEAVAVLFDLQPGMGTFDAERVHTHPGETKAIRVVALRPGQQPQVLLAPPEPIDSIDIADEVIAGGRVRAGAKPPPYDPYALAGIIVVGGVVGLIVHRRRRRSERHWAERG